MMLVRQHHGGTFSEVFLLIRAVLNLQSSIFNLPSSTFNPSSVFHLPSSIVNLQPVFRLPSSFFHRQPSTHLQSSIFNLQSSIVRLDNNAISSHTTPYPHQHRNVLTQGDSTMQQLALTRARISTFALALLLLVAPLGAAPPVAGAVATGDSPVEAVLRVRTPSYTLDAAGLRVEGYAVHDAPGAPALPVWGTAVELPPSGEWTITRWIPDPPRRSCFGRPSGRSRSRSATRPVRRPRMRRRGAARSCWRTGPIPPSTRPMPSTPPSSSSPASSSGRPAGGSSPCASSRSATIPRQACCATTPTFASR